MEEFEGKGQARRLHGWVLSPEEHGSLKLVLQYEPSADASGDGGGLVQLLLPAEAALYLADELNRQAQRTLDACAGGLPAADLSSSRGTGASPDQDREGRPAPKPKPP